mmetsp:Transcript_19177/g.47937  ORF Transcript_19177/g.47937 Transcript_19177/m.47937 type:complete len:869 (-) Transcript_19177:1237-3843(-)
MAEVKATEEPSSGSKDGGGEAAVRASSKEAHELVEMVASRAGSKSSFKVDPNLPFEEQWISSDAEQLRFVPPDLSDEAQGAKQRSGLQRPKSVFAPPTISLELGFFRRLFSILNSRFGDANGEISTPHFERTMLRIFKIVGETGEDREGQNFKAEDYDVDGSGAVGWWEFVSCWKSNDFAIRVTFAERVWLSIEDNGACILAQWIQTTVMIMIIISSTCFMVATLPKLKSMADGCSPRCDRVDATTALTEVDYCKENCEPEQAGIFWTLELLCVIIFSIEYGARFTAFPFSRVELFSQDVLLDMCLGDLPIAFQSGKQRMFNFFFSPPNLVDFFAIIPFYMELLLAGVMQIQGTAVLRVIRLTRLFRLMKAVKYFETLQIIGRVLRRSMQALSVLLFYLTLCVCFSASLLYFAESGEWDPREEEWMRENWINGDREPTPFKSIPHSFWWCFVTYTTVGYGDMVPFSSLGQMFGVATILVGLLVLAMPISVLSSNFGQVWQEHQEEMRLQAKSDEIEREAVETALAIKDPAEQFRRLLIEVYDEDALGERDFLGECQIEYDRIGLAPDQVPPEPRFETIEAPLCPNDLKHTNDKVVVKGSVKIMLSWTPLPFEVETKKAASKEDADDPAEKYKKKLRAEPPKRTHINYCGMDLWPGSLTVIVHSATDVSPADFSIFKTGGSSDPYAVIQCWTTVPASTGALAVKQLRTKTQYANLNPVWNEMMEFDYPWANADAKNTKKPAPGDLDTNNKALASQLDPALAAEMQMAQKAGSIGTYTSLNEKLLKMELDDAPDPYDKQAFDSLQEFKQEFRAEIDETKQMILDLMELMRKQHKQLVKELGLKNKGQGSGGLKTISGTAPSPSPGGAADK